MKIAPIMPPSHFQTPSSLGAAPSTQSFRDLLADSEAKRADQERMFGFGELGVFGADDPTAYQPEFTAEAAPSNAQFVSARSTGAEHQTVSSEEPGSEGFDVLAKTGGPVEHRSSAATARQAETPRSAATARHQMPSVPTALSGVQLARTAQAPPGETPPRVTVHQDVTSALQERPSMPARLMATSIRKDASARPSALDQPPRRPASNPNGLSLLFTDRNGSAQLVAAAGGMTAEGRAALRKAATAVLAEFGLDLGDLTLNGEAVEPFIITQTGAFDGDSTR